MIFVLIMWTLTFNTLSELNLYSLLLIIKLIFVRINETLFWLIKYDGY